MDGQRIRPSLRDLADDYDQLAFPELEQGQQPSVKITRTRPSTILNTSTPPPIPIVPTPPAPAQEEVAAPKPKAKSRFAVQREKEAAERAAAAARGAGDRFELDLDGAGALPRQSNMPRLVGEVIERDSSGAPPLAPTAPGPSAPSPLTDARPATGFPASAHLMFPRKPIPSGSTSVPTEEPSAGSGADPQSLPALLSSVSAENDDIIKNMSEAEILEEQRQIRESMGLSDAVIKMLEARGRQKVEQQQTRAQKRPMPEGVRAPTPRKETEKADDEDDEGSPEYIRRHFFPNEPANPNLDWMKASSNAPSSSIDASHTFDLQGVLFPPSAIDAAPAASTSHHVSSSSNLTLPSLLTLTTSSVPSQRSTSLLVLGRILANSGNESALGAKEWRQLRLDASQKAGWAMRDNNAGVASAAISLLSTLFRSEIDSPPVTSILAPGAEEPATILSSFLSTSPLPSLVQHLSHATLPSSVLVQILCLLSSILHLANPHSSSKSPAIDLLVTTPNLLESVSKRFVARPWPSFPFSTDEGDSAPTPLALTFFANIARSSRDAAKALFERKLLEPPLRFLSIPPWELEGEQQALGSRLVGATFELWEIVGRYGVGTSMRTKGASVLEAVGERVGGYWVEGAGAPNEDEVELLEQWFSLLSVWTTAAIDPHVTEHDILWTHVDDWGQSAMNAVRWALAQEDDAVSRRVLVGGLELLAVWLEGSKVNQSWRGEKQREWIKAQLGGPFEKEGRAVQLVHAALGRLGSSSGDEQSAAVVLAALHLSTAYEEDSNPPTPPLFTLDPSSIDPIFTTLQQTTSPTSTSLLVALLTHLPSSETRLARTLQVLRRLRAGNEVVARDLIDWVLQTGSSATSLALAETELPALHSASILRPFLTHAIVTSSSGRVVGPLHPTSRDLKLTASLHPFARQGPLLDENWPLVALNELLRSGTSEVFKQLPQGWDATELEVVRSSLALMRLAVEAGGGAVSPPLLIYDLVKVFMLEKDNTTSGTSGAEAEIFRDEVVQHSMSALLSPLRISSQPSQLLLADTRTSQQTMEGVSSLISSAPFYQLYTDLVGLYDSISLSHPLFGLVLLPSLSMAYPVDYRKLLWIDYTHLLRMLNFPVEEAIADRVGPGALASYLEPRERDESLLGAYADALVSRKIVQGSFLELVATQHISRALFGEDDRASEPMGRKLASAIVGQGGEEMMRRLLRYEQAQKEGEPLSMESVEGGERWESRKQMLKKLAGEQGSGRLTEWSL